MTKRRYKNERMSRMWCTQEFFLFFQEGCLLVTLFLLWQRDQRENWRGREHWQHYQRERRRCQHLRRQPGYQQMNIKPCAYCGSFEQRIDRYKEKWHISCASCSYLDNPIEADNLNDLVTAWEAWNSLKELRSLTAIIHRAANSISTIGAGGIVIAEIDTIRKALDDIERFIRENK